MTKKRKLQDLVSVGPATIKDLKLLKITTIEELIDQNYYELYERLCRLTSTKHDICVLDVFQCAIEQAKNPNLPTKQKQWYYWSRLRKDQK